MGSTTAVFILFILFGLSYQQDAVESGGVTCPENVNGLNGACLTSYPVDPSNSDFCSNAFALSQCLDASCLDTKYRDAIHTFVPPLFRPGSCPICSTVPTEVSESRKTCTVWGIYHTIDFNSNVVLCPQQNSTILLTNEYFTITALTNTTVDERLTSGILYPGITGIRFDYHGCAVYSRTWLSKDDWDARRIPAQGWFPHLITITQNTTEAVVSLLAVNTDLIIRKAGRYMSISIRTGLADVSEGICTTQNTTCVAEASVPGYPTAVAYTTCSKLPDQFQLGCQYDLDRSNNTSNLGLAALDASISFARINALSDSDNFGTINAREVAVPVVLTVVSTGLIIIIFFLALLIKCRRNQRRPSDSKTVLFFIGWIFLVLNTHVLGFVYPFTGLMFISVVFNIACLIAIWLLSSDILGNSLAPIQRSYKAFTIISLPQQFCIGVIGAAANEWYLWEVQFWWGIAVLVFLLFAGSFLAVTVLGLIWKSPEKPPKERPRKENRYVPEVELEAQVPEEVRVNQMQDRARASSVSSSGSSSSYSTKKPVETKPEPSHVINADPHVIVQPSHVVEPSHVISPPAQPNIYNNHVIDINPQPQHVVQPSHVIVPQEHVIQPQTQSHVIEPQPMYYGNATDAPPPPKDGGAFASPSPLDVYQNPGKYMSDQESSSDPARHMLKRAIKLAGVDVDGAKEAQIYAKMMELLQTYNLTGVVSRDDGEAATLRNNLATDLSEEIKLYQNDSLDELSYGLKEAILLWKEDNHL